MARGRVLRDQAAELSKQAQERQKKTNGLLADLLEHEGIAYYPQPQSRGGVLLTGTFAESKTAKIVKDAAALIQQAETIERQICRVEPPPSTSGRRTATVMVS